MHLKQIGILSTVYLSQPVGGFLYNYCWFLPCIPLGLLMVSLLVCEHSYLLHCHLNWYTAFHTVDVCWMWNIINFGCLMAVYSTFQWDSLIGYQRNLSLTIFTDSHCELQFLLHLNWLLQFHESVCTWEHDELIT